MNLGTGAARLRVSFVIAALCATVLLGFYLRLVDPLSSTVIPAEDPYTHMAIVREDLRTGELGPVNEGTNVYPPGMHAFLAAVWVFSGADLYEIIRIGPAVFGAIGILGMALLLWRHAGPVAAVVGSLGFAVAPEVIFRTTMMSPTAQDLALLPFLIYALLELAKGRMQWAGVAAPMALFLVFAHPWLFAILAAAGAVFVALTYVWAFSSSKAEKVSPLGLAGATAIIGGGLGLTLTGCGGYCGRGWLDLFPALSGSSWLAWLVITVSIAPLVALLFLKPDARTRFSVAPHARTSPWLVRLGASVAIAAALGWITWIAVTQGLPSHVDLPRMIGWPILLLAAFAFVALPFAPSRLGHLGAGLIVATYPLVIFNPLNSPFWSHRTVVFLAVGLVILAGLAAATIARWTATLIAALPRASTKRNGTSRQFAAILAVSLISIGCAGTVYAGTPDGYPGGWYRLYPACELEALKDISAMADASPATVVVVGSWEPKLVLSALTQDSYRIWYADAFFTNPDERDDTLASLAKQGRPVIFVVDRYLLAAHPEAKSFTDEGSWKPLGEWCSAQGTGQPRVLAFEAVVTP